MDKYCVEHGVEYGGSFCPACDLQVKLDEMTRFEVAKESDLQVECGETERLKEELDEMTRIDAILFNDLRAERDKAEAEVERLRTAAGKFHDLYHASWMRSSPTFPDCDCELATALHRKGEQ